MYVRVEECKVEALNPFGLIIRFSTKPSLVIWKNKARCKVHLEVLILLEVYKVISVKAHESVAHLVPLSMDSKLDGVRKGLVNVPFL